jgi:predicted ester cyclase
MLNHRSHSPVRGCLLAVILIFLSASISLAEPADRLEQNKALVLESIAALDAGDLDNLDKFIADDYKRHCQATPGAIVASLDDFKALLREWEGTYSDVVTTVDVMIAEGDLVAFIGSYTAVQTGPMGPFPATGKQLVSEFAGYHRIANGKIVETWVTWDNLAALMQLGLFPPPEAKKDHDDVQE